MQLFRSTYIHDLTAAIAGATSEECWHEPVHLIREQTRGVLAFFTSFAIPYSTTTSKFPLKTPANLGKNLEFFMVNKYPQGILALELANISLGVTFHKASITLGKAPESLLIVWERLSGSETVRNGEVGSSKHIRCPSPDL